MWCVCVCARGRTRVCGGLKVEPLPFGFLFACSLFVCFFFFAFAMDSVRVSAPCLAAALLDRQCWCVSLHPTPHTHTHTLSSRAPPSRSSSSVFSFVLFSGELEHSCVSLWPCLCACVCVCVSASSLFPPLEVPCDLSVCLCLCVFLYVCVYVRTALLPPPRIFLSMLHNVLLFDSLRLRPHPARVSSTPLHFPRPIQDAGVHSRLLARGSPTPRRPLSFPTPSMESG